MKCIGEHVTSQRKSAVGLATYRFTRPVVSSSYFPQISSAFSTAKKINTIIENTIPWNKICQVITVYMCKWALWTMNKPRGPIQKLQYKWNKIIALCCSVYTTFRVWEASQFSLLSAHHKVRHEAQSTGNPRQHPHSALWNPVQSECGNLPTHRLIVENGHAAHSEMVVRWQST